MVVAKEFILDTSFTLAWIFPDETNALADKVLDELLGERAVAHMPSLWPLEMLNVIHRGPRKGLPAPSAAEVEDFFSMVKAMPIRIHHQGLEILSKEARRIMSSHHLSAYDTAYLMLAKRLALPLGTEDKKLALAALGEAVEVLA